MPTYDYRCKACEHEFELFQSMSDSVKRKCPECGKLKLERLIGIGAAVIFKGDGFYQTDYRSESYKKAAAADAKSSSDSKGSDKDSSSKAETKTDTKSKPSKDSNASSSDKQSSKSPTNKKPTS